MILESIYFTSVVAQYMTATSITNFTANPGYIDPGTGSLIIQVAIGILVGGMVSAKILWRRMAGSFVRVFYKTSRIERTDN